MSDSADVHHPPEQFDAPLVLCPSYELGLFLL